jgi:hypothetical protein
MPTQPFIITFTVNGWECHPPHETVPRSEGVRFNVVVPPGSPGCRVCCNNPEVFQAHFFDLSAGITLKEFKGPVNSSTGFHVQDSGSDCISPPETEPYDVTIGSGTTHPGGPGHEHGYGKK